MFVSLALSTGPAGARLFGIPGAVWHGLLLAVTTAAFAWILWRRLAPLVRAAPEPRFDRLGERLRRLLVVGFLQARQPRYPVAGTLHILIFFGFLVLLLRSLTLLGEGFVDGFTLPGLGGRAGGVYAAVKDWTALVVLACCAVAAFRRLVVRPARYHDRHARRSHGAEAYVILGAIALLLFADAVYEGSNLVGGGRTPALPLAAAAAGLLEGRSTETVHALGLAGFWVHNLVLCAFACYLPLSKHFHVITALPNVFFGKLAPSGRIKPPRFGVEDSSELERIGVRGLADLTWKQLLDAYTCTDCGRCSAACPAYRTGTALSPRMLSVKTRDEAYAAYPVLGKGPERPALVGDVVADEELWACTTCGACEEACPVLIGYTDRIVDMRRSRVDDGCVPPPVQKALADVEKRGNPYGKLGRKRGDWVRDPDGDQADVRVLAAGDGAELLYFTDSATAYDPRLQRIARALGRVLAEAGVDVGTLGKDEADSGNEVRRIGEEGLFEELRDRNVDALQARACERVVASDPHAFNALRNDYELDVPVLHHTQLLDELVSAGRLALGPLGEGAGRTYTYHDPCYLGRHNDVYDAPRRVLGALPGVKTVEMEASRARSFCCGGGSLYLFHESECDERMGEVRLAMAEEAGADVIVTACPFCLIHLEDAIKTTGRADRMEVRDLAELVCEAMVETPARESAPV